MKGIYLASCLARHPDYNIIYNDFDDNFKPDLCCDMMQVDLSDYDFIIASPPCNFWSRANYRFLSSQYSLSTKHLLPSILEKCALSGKPFIVENVFNVPRMTEYGIFDICDKYHIYYQFIGRHTYFTNYVVDLNNIQFCDFVAKKQHYSKDASKYRQGGENVHNTIEAWLKYIHSNEKKLKIQTLF